MKNGCTVIVLLCRINVYTEPGKMASTGFHDFPHAIKHDEKNAIWVFLLPMLDLDKRIETKSLYMPDNKNFCLRVKALMPRKNEGHYSEGLDGNSKRVPYKDPENERYGRFTYYQIQI